MIPVLIATAAGALYIGEKIGDYLNDQRGVALQPYQPAAPAAPGALMGMGVGLVLVGVAAWWVLKGWR